MPDVSTADNTSIITRRSLAKLPSSAGNAQGVPYNGAGGARLTRGLLLTTFIAYIYLLEFCALKLSWIKFMSHLYFVMYILIFLYKVRWTLWFGYTFQYCVKTDVVSYDNHNLQFTYMAKIFKFSVTMIYFPTWSSIADVKRDPYATCAAQHSTRLRT